MLLTKVLIFTSKREGNRKSNSIIFIIYKPIVYLKGFSLFTNKKQLSILRAYLKVTLSKIGIEIQIQALVEQSKYLLQLLDKYYKLEDSRLLYYKNSVQYAKLVIRVHFTLTTNII